MQMHARLCDKNKLEKTDTYWNNFVVKDFKDTSLKDHIGRVGGHIKMILILKDDST